MLVKTLRVSTRYFLRILGVGEEMAETKKAFERRKRSDFFRKYCRGSGIDVGCGDDPLKDITITSLVKYNQVKIDDSYTVGDAAFLDEFPDETFDFVYSSHCLEHIQNYREALRNWFRVLKIGGYLLLLLPHRKYYEGKRQLPSIYNPGHRVFFLPFQSEEPDTVSVYDLIKDVYQEKAIIIYLNECCERDVDREYSIEVVVERII